MKRLLSILLITTSLASAEIPEIDIRPIPNNNDITEKTTGRVLITQEQFRDRNFTDINDVLKFVGDVGVVQSGPRGQQTSVFTRGTNSNHTLVLLNGIPINDQSTTNGMYDFGQEFLSNLTAIEVYRGPSAAYFGPDAIGGAVNLITSIDYQNRMSVGSDTGGGNIGGNYYKNIDGWDINVKGGVHHSNSGSALAGGTDKDSATNKSIAINTRKQIDDNWSFWSSTFGRNTYAQLDGHSLSLQNGYDSNNTFYAQQFGFDRKDRDSTSFITFHTHTHDREYTSPGDELDNYKATAYTLRTEHRQNQTDKFSWGVGSEFRNDSAAFQNRGDYNSSLDADYHTLGFFGNLGYKFTDTVTGSLHLRNDNNSVVGSNNSMKVGLQKNNALPNVNLRTSFSTGFKVPSLYELYGADNYGYTGNRSLKAEQSQSAEVGADYKITDSSMFSVTLFQSHINNMIDFNDNYTYVNTPGTTRQSGVELGYSQLGKDQSFKLFATSLSSEKADGSAQLRRPELSLGANLMQKLSDNYRFTANYKFTGNYLDINNNDYSNITMPSTHLLDVGIRKDMGGYEIGFNIFNLLDTNYQQPHGFGQQGRHIGLVIGRTF